MIVRHQKKQQSICKLPSWKYMQMKREDCSSWKTTIIPWYFLYTRTFTNSTYTVLCSYTKIIPHRRPLKEWLLKCKPKRSIPNAPRSYTVLPSSLGYRPVLAGFPQQKEVVLATTFHQCLFFLCYCWSRSLITRRNLY